MMAPMGDTAPDRATSAATGDSADGQAAALLFEDQRGHGHHALDLP